MGSIVRGLKQKAGTFCKRPLLAPPACDGDIPLRADGSDPARFSPG